VVLAGSKLSHHYFLQQEGQFARENADFDDN
jgi:hypothetical protein